MKLTKEQFDELKDWLTSMVGKDSYIVERFKDKYACCGKCAEGHECITMKDLEYYTPTHKDVYGQ